MKKIEINCETGVETLLDCTEEEIATAKAALADEEAEAKAKADAKAELLAKLGITEDEAKLLLS